MSDLGRVGARVEPILGRARRRLEGFNQRHPWNHNEHFHGWILRNLPARRGTALDVGCGAGLLAEKLSPHFERVIGIDADEGMATAAAARLADDPRASVRRSRFEEFAADQGDGALDLVTMVAVLHHLDLEATLARIPRLLTPGGRLLVVGLARVGSPMDLAVDCVSAVLNPVVGVIKHPRPAPVPDQPSAGSHMEPAMPVRDPTTTWSEVAAAARTRLPGSAVRRRLFFRYTLRWDSPR